MGTVVPFPVRRTQGVPHPGEPRGVRVPPEHSGEVVILQVVQWVRPPAEPLPPTSRPAGEGL